jgi:hypothetical protein
LRKRVGFEEHFAICFDGEAQAIGIEPGAAEHPPDCYGAEGLEQSLEAVGVHGPLGQAGA